MSDALPTETPAVPPTPTPSEAPTPSTETPPEPAHSAPTEGLAEMRREIQRLQMVAEWCALTLRRIGHKPPKSVADELP